MPSLVTERIESVKAGIVGAGSFAIAESILILGRSLFALNFPQYHLAPVVFNWQLLIQLAIGATSGFLFGVTYRYIIRDDRNSHLNDGAVLAFGLIRGLALVENNLERGLIVSEIVALVLLVLEGIICFEIARSILDLAIKFKLIKPFI